MKNFESFNQAVSFSVFPCSPFVFVGWDTYPTKLSILLARLNDSRKSSMFLTKIGLRLNVAIVINK